MIVDSHLHCWKLSSEHFPWNPLGTFKPDYEWPIENEIEVMDKYGIDGGVLVQVSMYGFDNRYLVDCGRRYPDRLALVGMVDPRADSVESEMESLAEQGVKGLRLAPVIRPEIRWYNDSKADRLWRKAGELGWILALLVSPDQVASVAKAIRRFPEVRVVIDHIARPDLAEESERSELFGDLVALGEFEQVYVKVSCLAYISQAVGLSRGPQPHQDIMNLVRRLVDAYGPERLMWGTDTPGSQDPDELPNAMRWFELGLPELSAEEQALIMGEAAARLWGWT